MKFSGIVSIIAGWVIILFGWLASHTTPPEMQGLMITTLLYAVFGVLGSALIIGGGWWLHHDIQVLERRLSQY